MFAFIHFTSEPQRHAVKMYVRAIFAFTPVHIWPWPLTHDLENPVNSSPKCSKYSCKFSFRSVNGSPVIKFTRFRWLSICDLDLWPFERENLLSCLFYWKTIWTFNFLQVVRQYILGVVGNVTHCFVGNLTCFPAVKEFWKLVKMWRNYSHKRVTRFFWATVYFQNASGLRLNLTTQADFDPSLSY